MNSLMWTATTRAQHRRDGLRFASDLTGPEWAVIEPLPPPPAVTGRPPAWPMREIVNAIFYVLRGSVAWLGRKRRLAKDFGATIGSAVAFIYAATAMLPIRRLARCA